MHGYDMTTATLVLRNVSRRRQRTVLTLLAVGVCLFLFTSLLTVLETLGSMVEKSHTHRRVVVHSRTSLGVPMPVTYQARIERIPGVEAVMSMVMCLGFGRTESFLVGAAAVEPESYIKVMYEQLPTDEELKAFCSERTGALGARHIFEHEKLKLGDRLTVRVIQRPISLDLKLVGMLTKNLNPTTLFFNRKYWTELAGEQGANLYFVKVSSMDVMPQVVEAIEKEFANDLVMVDAEPEYAMVSSFIVAQGNVLALVRGVGFLVLLSITLVVGNSMAMTVRERTHELGILKALGFSTRKILAMILGESVLLTASGGGLGSLSAYLILSHGFSAGFGPLSSLTVRASTVALGLTVSLAVGLVAGGIPAWRAARQPVLACLRRVV